MHRTLLCCLLVALTACAGAPATTPDATRPPAFTPARGAAPSPTPTGAVTAAHTATTTATPSTPSPPTATPIPPTITALPSTPTPPPTAATPARIAIPGRVAVVAEQVGHYRSAAGVRYFFGEVVNRGDVDVAGLRVAVTLVGDAGQTIASGRATQIGIDLLAPGERTVWAAPIPDAPASWQDARVEAQAVAATAEARGRIVAGLTVEDAVAQPPGDQTMGIAVAGLVRNGGDAPARFPFVTVGCYDTAGALVMVDSGPAQQQTIAPGATAPFSVSVPHLVAPPARVVAYAKGSR